MIRDQRHLLGPREHRTVGDVVAYWGRHRNDTGFVRDWTEIPRRGLAIVDSGETRTAYVNHGRWLVKCGRRWEGGYVCNDTASAWPYHRAACCLGCGTVYRAEFPQVDLDELAAVMAHRPKRARNFLPEHETLADLKVENLLHGAALPVVSVLG